MLAALGRLQIQMIQNMPRRNIAKMRPNDMMVRERRVSWCFEVQPEGAGGFQPQCVSDGQHQNSRPSAVHACCFLPQGEYVCLWLSSSMATSAFSTSLFVLRGDEAFGGPISKVPSSIMC